MGYVRVGATVRVNTIPITLILTQIQYEIWEDWSATWLTGLGLWVSERLG